MARAERSQKPRRSRHAGLSDQLSTFKEGARAGAISLLAAFYFRQAPKIEGERTFEFSHKSFGEYLTARRIVRWIEDIQEERARNHKSRQRGWSEEEALIKWVEVTGPAVLDPDLLVFVEREVAIREREVVQEWQKTLTELASDQLTNGLPMHKLGLASYQEMSWQARNAEEALFMALGACATHTKYCSDVIWAGLRSFVSMHNRLYAHATEDFGFGVRHYGGSYQIGFQYDTLCQRISMMLNLKSQDLGGYLLSSVDFSGSDLSHASAHGLVATGSRFAGCRMVSFAAHAAVMAGCVFHGVDLSEADLELADLEDTMFVGVNMEYANLDRANLIGARLEKTILRGSRLARAHLLKANLDGANIRDVDLTATNLKGADLEGADFQGANLENANLENANLERANLVGVRGMDRTLELQTVQSWRGARIERKWVERLGLDAEMFGLEVVDDVDDD